VRHSHQYQSYEEERGSDREFEAHQDRLADEADERDNGHHFDLTDTCTRCGLWDTGSLGECAPPEVTRTNQKALECYVVGEDSDNPVTVFVVASDGVGRHFFDTEEEALDDHEGFGSDTPVHYVESADE
jgi:hypothetical protein